MKKKYITKLMIAACLSSALSLNSCIEEVFPESSTATIDQIGKSDQAKTSSATNPNLTFLILMEYVMIWVMPMLSIPFGIITTSF